MVAFSSSIMKIQLVWSYNLHKTETLSVEKQYQMIDYKINYLFDLIGVEEANHLHRYLFNFPGVDKAGHWCNKSAL